MISCQDGQLHRALYQEAASPACARKRTAPARRSRAGEQKLICAAEEVRAARVAPWQARLATIPPADEPAATLAAKLAAQMEVLRTTPAEAILEEFGVRLTRCCTWDHGEAAMIVHDVARSPGSACGGESPRGGRCGHVTDGGGTGVVSPAPRNERRMVERPVSRSHQRRGRPNQARRRAGAVVVHGVRRVPAARARRRRAAKRDGAHRPFPCRANSTRPGPRIISRSALRQRRGVDAEVVARLQLQPLAGARRGRAGTPGSCRGERCSTWPIDSSLRRLVPSQVHDQHQAGGAFRLPLLDGQDLGELQDRLVACASRRCR